VREILKSHVGDELIQLIAEKDPLEEDIAILDEQGDLLAVVLTPHAYDFLQRKVEEAEDEMDRHSAEDFRGSGEKP